MKLPIDTNEYNHLIIFVYIFKNYSLKGYYLTNWIFAGGGSQKHEQRIENFYGEWHAIRNTVTHDVLIFIHIYMHWLCIKFWAYWLKK